MKQDRVRKIYDCHIHIGQFENIYYNPYKVVEVLSHYNIAGAYISSTTSCVQWDNLEEKKTVLNHIRSEIDELLLYSQEIGFDARPLCWMIPQRYLEGDTVEQIYYESAYRGFKIHPRAHQWDLRDDTTCHLMDEMCRYAKENNIPIWIHTGVCDFELPNKFEQWFIKNPNVTFVLAHCKVIDSMKILFQKYNNVLGDVSFSPPKAYESIVKAGFSQRMLFGTDFPITTFKLGMRAWEDKELYQNYGRILDEWENYFQSFGSLQFEF